MQLFVRVADAGSFSKAARSSGIAQPTVSKQIAALEKRLGVQLLRRTSRGLSVTEAGRSFYDAAVQLLGDLEAAEQSVGRGHTAPGGLLRVAISAGFGRMYVVPRLPEFFALYPNMSVELDISERHVSLVEDGIDVAIRIGNLSDSSLTARRIGSMEAVTAATPAYLKRNGEPKNPKDLEQHDCVVFVFQGAPRPWQFKGTKGPITIEPKGLVRSNDAEHIRAAVLSGLGICHNASWLFAPELENGAVRQVLTACAPPPYPIHAVTPGGRRVSGKARVFMDFLAQICAENPYLKIR